MPAIELTATHFRFSMGIASELSLGSRNRYAPACLFFKGRCTGDIVLMYRYQLLDRRELISELITSGSYEAQINRCGAYTANIASVAYPQKSKAARKATEAEESRSSVRQNDADNAGDGSRKRRRDGGADYQANYFGPRGWVDDYRGNAERERSEERDSKRLRTSSDTPP